MEAVVDKGMKVFLELGCGLGFFGEALTREGWVFIGVDISITALRKLKQRLVSRGITDYLLVLGDINHLPIAGECVDLVSGFGVVEHLRQPENALFHVHRVLRLKGVSFNTVPYLNLGNILYRSVMWGSIPNVPVLRQVLTFVNVVLLKGKHMVFGFELQLSESQLRRMHTAAGFQPEDVRIEQYKCKIQLHHVWPEWLRGFARRLSANNRMFWPMVKVIAYRRNKETK
jgi:ubiquinone/menaquinone biosynthesis C-methylase UbiE